MRNNMIVAVWLILIVGCGTNREQAGEPPTGYASAAELGSFCERLPRAAYAAFQKDAATDDWFEVYEVGPQVWAIYEPFQWQEGISYLIVGGRSAVLFDTGNGSRVPPQGPSASIFVFDGTTDTFAEIPMLGGIVKLVVLAND